MRVRVHPGTVADLSRIDGIPQDPGKRLSGPWPPPIQDPPLLHRFGEPRQATPPGVLPEKRPYDPGLGSDDPESPLGIPLVAQGGLSGPEPRFRGALEAVRVILAHVYSLSGPDLL